MSGDTATSPTPVNVSLTPPRRGEPARPDIDPAEARARIRSAEVALLDHRRLLTGDELAGLAALPDDHVTSLAALAHQVRLAWCGPEVEVEGILSAKTGGCPEDCHFCSQSSRFDTPVKATPFLDADEVLRAARETKEAGASEFQGERLRTFEPLIYPPNREEHVLSFVNLVEAHVLKAVRRRHLVHMIKVRSAIENLKQRYRYPHPLADIDLLAGGRDLFLEEHGTLLNLSLGEQVSMDFLAAYLSPIERDFGRPNTPFLHQLSSFFRSLLSPSKLEPRLSNRTAKLLPLIHMCPSEPDHRRHRHSNRRNC